MGRVATGMGFNLPSTPGGGNPPAPALKHSWENVIEKTHSRQIYTIIPFWTTGEPPPLTSQTPSAGHTNVMPTM